MSHRETVADLRQMAVADLATAIEQTEAKLLELRFATSFRKLKSTSDLGKTRKQIARLQTILREKLAAASAPAQH